MRSIFQQSFTSEHVAREADGQGAQRATNQKQNKSKAKQQQQQQQLPRDLLWIVNDVSFAFASSESRDGLAEAAVSAGERSPVESVER